ncbi:MAG: hypothetical protein IAE79_28260, partial [Anaerolinea sp.]|nr:hypothetical protein [Anaerolinea sp.]
MMRKATKIVIAWLGVVAGITGLEHGYKDKRTALTILSILAMILLLASSLTAILLDDGGAPYLFTTPRGEQVEIYGGDGPYQFDNTYKAIAFRSFDWANLAVVLPLFIAGLWLYRRSKLSGELLLAALFTYLAYIYLIGVIGNAFNALFLVWTALFSIGVFSLCLMLTQMDFAALPAKLAGNFPRKAVAVYVLGLGLLLLVVQPTSFDGFYSAKKSIKTTLS